MRHGAKVEVEVDPEGKPGEFYKTEALRVGEGIFKFDADDEVSMGSNIRVENGKDIWRVVDIMDEMSRFEGKIGHKVFVQRVGHNGQLIDHNAESRASFYGPTAIGVMQVGGVGNTATGSALVNVQAEQTINKLMEVFQKSDEIEDTDKEQALEALEKITQLSRREQTRGVLDWIKRSVTTVAEIATRGQQLATVVMPLVEEIRKHWPHIPW